MAGTIKRSTVLNFLDIKETNTGNPVIFSIKFDKKDGERVFLPYAISCGLRANMKKNRFRGAQPVDKTGKPFGHRYPVCIDFIIEFNGRKVTL